MRGSIISPNNSKRYSRACCDRRIRKRCIDVIVWNINGTQAALYRNGANVNTVARKAGRGADSPLRHLPRPTRSNSGASSTTAVDSGQSGQRTAPRERRVRNVLLRAEKEITVESLLHSTRAFLATVAGYIPDTPSRTRSFPDNISSCQ
jgi:hypothetical protein